MTSITGQTETEKPVANAAANRKENPRSSLVLAVVAAEVGFKQFASKVFPDAGWVLEKLSSPPLDTMLQAFPWSKLGVQINEQGAGHPRFNTKGTEEGGIPQESDCAYRSSRGTQS